MILHRPTHHNESEEQMLRRWSRYFFYRDLPRWVQLRVVAAHAFAVTIAVVTGSFVAVANAAASGGVIVQPVDHGIGTWLTDNAVSLISAVLTGGIALGASFNRLADIEQRMKNDLMTRDQIALALASRDGETKLIAERLASLTRAVEKLDEQLESIVNGRGHRP